MVNIDVKVDSKAVRRGLEMFPKETAAGYQRSVYRQTLWAERSVKQGLSQGETLRKEIRLQTGSRVSGKGMRTRGVVATNHRFAKMIEYGATIRPKKSGRTYIKAIKPDGTVVTGVSKGKYLAIPADDVKTREGKRSRGAYVSNAIQRTAGGPFYSWVRNGVIYWRRYGEDRVRVGGFLKTSVTIPARPIWRPTARRARVRMVSDMRKVIRNAKKKARLG